MTDKTRKYEDRYIVAADVGGAGKEADYSVCAVTSWPSVVLVMSFRAGKGAMGQLGTGDNPPTELTDPAGEL